MTDKTTNFYRAFEDRYRGSRELIKARLKVYLPFIVPLHLAYPEASAIDIGCGRGEWLELLRENNITASGVDMDEGMLSACRELALTVNNGDGVSHLKSLPSDSQSVVSGFHLVEHISFEALQDLVCEALRVLKPGGLLILETPNPENIIVGTANFYLDPTHVRPIPPLLLSFLAEHCGFVKTKILRLHEGVPAEMPPSLFKVFFGASQDYSLVAQKGGSPDLELTLDDLFQKDRGITHVELANTFERGLMERLAGVQQGVEMSNARATQAEAHAIQAEAHAIQAEAHAIQAEAHATQAEARATQAEAHATQAEARAIQAEARAIQAEAQFYDLLNSKSWKITAPLRSVGAKVRGTFGWARQQKTNAKEFVRRILKRLKLYVNQRPRLKRNLLGVLNKFPKLKQKLISVVSTSPVLSSQPLMTQTMPELTASAQKIYDEIQLAFKDRARK